MESLNLNTLATSLPTANVQNAEKDLLNNFKAAALSITTLYRSSRHASKRSYNAGYAAACHDLLMMIQQGVSVGGIGDPSSGSHDPEGGGMTIGKVMDWIEARLEAIRSREEEEDEDEEKEKERERRKNLPTQNQPDPELPKPPTPTQDVSTTPGPVPQRKDQVDPPLPASGSSSTSNTTRPSPPSPTTPNTALRPIYPPNPSQRPRARLPQDSKHASDRQPFPTDSVTTSILTPLSTPFTFTAHPTPMSPSPPSYPIPYGHPLPAPDITAGSKRRHAVMMLLDSSSLPAVTAATPSGTSRSHSPLQTSNNNSVPHTQGASLSRRRTRSTRGLHAQHPPPSEAMDVEEDNGRERKRVSRRPAQ